MNQQQQVGGSELRELERNFSPINSEKTFGVRYGLAKQNSKKPAKLEKLPNDPAMKGFSPPHQGKGMNHTMINFGSNNGQMNYMNDYEDSQSNGH